jgi:hypothetical protein
VEGGRDESRRKEWREGGTRVGGRSGGREDRADLHHPSVRRRAPSLWRARARGVT